MKVKDLTGQKFTRLTVVSRAENNKSGQARWLCRCDCGNETVVLGYNLRRGLQKSCGCYLKDHPNRCKHGMRRTRIYGIWQDMKYRCAKVDVPKFKNYGGRGIKVCDEWQEFEPFYEWAMKNGYSDDLSIDRIDVNGNYEPSNCQWTDRTTQANNTTVNLRFDYNGKNMTVAEIARESGIPKSLLYGRLEAGHSLEESMKYNSGKMPRKPPNGHYITWNGKTQNIGQWARELGITESCLKYRLMVAKWSVEKALSTPVASRKAV